MQLPTAFVEMSRHVCDLGSTGIGARAPIISAAVEFSDRLSTFSRKLNGEIALRGT
jgi:hypothetical protein